MPDTLIRDTALDVVQKSFPIALGRFDPAAKPTGLVIVDEVNGFCTVGDGPLAPAAPNAQVDQMIAETVWLARRFEVAGWPILAFLDTHIPGKAEPPYPPHCEIGTGQENLVAELEWLGLAQGATLIRKDCINGFIGAIEPDGRNRLLDWIAANGLKSVLVVGICTDICVMDFVLTLLSARNHGMAGDLEDIVVYEPGCATYDLPLAVARDLGLPETAAHPQQQAHHVGLYLMASRGAVLAGELTL
jgi:nicotinamidase-related amidase